jgi:penicillin-binding protein 2
MELTHEYTSDVEHRFKYAFILIAAALLIVIGRLYYLQVIKGNFYRFFSTENSIKESNIPAVRGMIFDRRGQVLVESRPSYNVIVIPQYVIDPPKVLRTISKYLNIPLEELQAKWLKREKQAPYQAIVMSEDLSPDQVSEILARKGPWYDENEADDFRGMEVVVDYQRTYPNGTLAAHLLGYVKEIDQERLGRYQKLYPHRYFIGDKIGLAGVEETWDLELRGFDGYEQHVVNAVGREVDFEGIAEELEQKPAIPGNSLILALDRDVQEVAQAYFEPGKGGESLSGAISKGKSGAAVMVDVRDGGIIAMYSSPSYDLNLLSSREGSQYWNSIASDSRGYLINRAIQGAYPPGSTFKPVTALAALSEKVVKPEETIRCGGGIIYGGRPFHCWRKGGHGAISVHRAIVESCDVYFYLMGLRLGVDRIAKYAKMLGLGSKTGVPLPEERSGLIPTSEWKKTRFGVPWQEGETLSVAVGQSYDLVTPLQNALVAAQIANGGKRITPHLVQAMFDPYGKEIYRWTPPENSDDDIGIPEDVVKIVRDGMIGVVGEPGGTGHRLSTYKVKMGGKTGTAQVISLGTTVCSGEKCRDHAWFIGFAPAENPEVAAAAVVEHGGFGASAAAPIVGAMLQKYFDVKEQTK